MARKVERSLIRNEVEYIPYVLYNLGLRIALVFSPRTGDGHRKGDGLVFLHVVGQPYVREASPAEFVLDTVHRVEYFPNVARTIQAFLVSLTRLSICLYLAFIIRIHEIAKVV